ncbi:hypothetical protein ASPACDRAFT_123391 [Aspergillus aculeatus ATCC 16872]|uniref:Uncharacterized protein n=1 Tax=Aspergillus aculeatus (strain ATCC 16872 / CBS 172.66 / WB 5094) TaxID=690307 RepID=A0A1L9WMU6_ASPA1|nr:uncharacterized protein ASPACDRAFT_123391 [Aspergillus aculeatus ATCC 16872]OJJ97488.1 hypothetical protein ASPACDRAFT_123391 [Aspergillus aculeatus ATCC 16872]
MERAWESINAVCRPEFPIPGAFNLGERVVVNAVFVSNLGQRPNPSPTPPPVPRYYGGESQPALHAVSSYRGVARLSSYLPNAATGSTSQSSSSASRVTSPASRSTVDLPSYMSTSTSDATSSGSQSSFASSSIGDSSDRSPSVLPTYPIARHNSASQSTHHLPLPSPPTSQALSSSTTGLPSYPVTATATATPRQFHGPLNSHPTNASYDPPPANRLQRARTRLQAILEPLGRSLTPSPRDYSAEASSVWVNIGNHLRTALRKRRYGEFLWRRRRQVEQPPCPRGPRGPCPFPMAPGYLMAADPEEVREEREVFRFGQMVGRERCINSGLHVWEDVMPVIEEVEPWEEESQSEDGDSSWGDSREEEEFEEEEEVSEEVETEVGAIEEVITEEEASKDKGKGKLERVEKGDECYEGTSDSEDSVGSDESDLVDPILIS